MLTRLLNYLSENPYSGLGTWAAGWIGSFIPEFQLALFSGNVAELRAAHIFYFQMASLLIGTIVGVLTIVTLIQKIIRNRKFKSNDSTKISEE